MAIDLVSTDARGRASLGRPNRDYRLTEQSDGTLVLEPVAVLSELEHRFLNNTELQAQLEHARSHPERRVRRQRRRLSDAT